ncbi:MAG: glycoside hydrolase family 38 C-terminal domain-containing protein [Prevotellaceae bacterium]|nr:glycoside hydrolase family 38 C-terminal domain-containing protein [Prevotellaceae bacterium]
MKFRLPIKHKFFFAVLLVCVSISGYAQRYFVDGFHGGVYGHYPMMTYTQFMYDQLQQHPDWYIGLEIEPETWDTVRVKTPEAYELFKGVIGGRQVEYTNPSYAQSYLYCIEGESMIRQFQLGMAKLRSHFPDVRIETYACEEPCYTSCLPTILSQLGFKYLTLKCPNTCWGGYARNFGGQFVNLIGPDGTGMTTVPRYACEGLEPNSVWQTMGWGNTRLYWDACDKAGIKQPISMTFQDAGWTKGPWIGYGQQQHGTQYTLWSDYCEKYAPTAEKPDYRMSQEDVCPGLMWGSQVMQQLALNVRRAENYLVNAEKCMVIENLMSPGKNVQLINGETTTQMNEAWRTLLLSEHHDCWIVPYNRLNIHGTWADNVALWTKASIDIARNEVEKALPESNGNGYGWLFFNTLPYARKQIVEDGNKTFAVEVPAFGYAKIADADIVEATATKDILIKKHECKIENGMYRMVLDLKKGGVVQSLVVKDGKTEYVDDKSDYSFGELRGYFKKNNAFCSSTEKPATATVIKDNSLVKSVSVKGEIAGVPFTKVITMTEGDPKIKVELTIDWDSNTQIGDFTFANPKRGRREKGPQRVNYYDTRYMLNVFFPTTVGESKIVKDAPFDVCESKLEDTYYNRWDSIKHNVVLNWIDQQGESGNSLAVFSDRTTSYSFGKDYPMALTVQYSGPGLWGRNYVIKEPNKMVYHIMPHKGNWEDAHLQMHDDMLNTPETATQTKVDRTESHSFLSLDGTGYTLSAFINDGDAMTLRIFNSEGDAQAKTIKIPANVKSMERVDLQGNVLEAIPITTLGEYATAEVSMPRFAVTTYRMK